MMQLRDALNDRKTQSQSASTMIQTAIGLTENLEHVTEHRRVETVAGIGDLDLNV
jgi:hypothetical protein